MVTASQARDRGPVARRIAATYLAPRWRAMVIAFGCALAFAVVTALLLQILRPAVNDVTAISVAARRGGDSQGPLSRLIGLAGLVVLLALVKGGMQIAQATLVNSIGNGVVGDIQLRLFKGLVRADLGRLRDTHSGGHISSVLYDASLIREAATSGLVNLVQQSLTLAAVIVVMFVMDWRLSLLVVVAGPIVVFVLRRFSRRAGKAARGAMEATGALSSAIMESLDGVRVVKIENREAYEEHRVAAVIAERQRHIIAGDNARAFAAPTSETLMTGVVAAVLIYEGWQAAAGHTDIGGFIAFFAALLQAGNAVRQVANYPGLYSQGLAAARRLFAALDIQAEIRDPPGAPALHVERGGVRFDDVTFAYGNGEPVLRDVSLTLERGETVALVGPSGAGKSTVLNLIPRFYDVGGGAVTIDGQDVRAVGLASLRSRIGLVTQEPFLFDDTIGANIAYSLPDAGPAAIEAAARAAAAHDFIVSLPRGYDTRVGEAGARLSGGQRQRIAIARAFLKDAPILLLDEATSALDAESEAQVQAALARLMAGRTTLLIAHRLSTVRSADRIYVLDRGVVVETGSHEALVAAGGLYRRLAQGQNLAHPEAAAS